MIEEVCICNHLKSDHLKDGEKYIHTIPSLGDHWCVECSTEGFRGFHTFKLDNLKYVEKLAEERNLL